MASDERTKLFNVRKYLKQSILIGGISTVGSSLVTLSLAPILIRQIGLVNYGVWALLATFTGVAVVIDLGIARSVVYYLMKARHPKRKIHAFSTGLFLLISLVAFLTLFAAIYAISDFNLDFKLGDVPPLILPIVIFYGIIVTGLVLLINFFRAILESQMKIHLAQALTFTFHLLNYGSACIVAFFTKDIKLLIQTSCLIHFIVLGLYVFVSYRLGLPPIRRPVWKVARILIGRSSGYFLLGLVNIVTVPFNRILVTSIGGSTAHALFDLGLKVAMAATGLLQTISSPLFALFSKLRTENARRALTIAGKMTGLVFLLYLSGVLVLFFSSDWLAGYLTSVESAKLKDVLLILVVGVAFTSVAEPSMRASWAWGLERATAFIRIAGLCGNVFIAILWTSLDPVIRISAGYSIPLFLGSLVQISLLFRITVLQNKGEE